MSFAGVTVTAVIYNPCFALRCLELFLAKVSFVQLLFSK